MTITATPTVPGSFSSTVMVSASPGAVTPLQISVTATVVQGGVFNVSRATIDLGNVLVGAPATKQTVTVTALVALSDLAVNLNGADVTKDATSTCQATLAAGASCDVVVNFAAVSNGSRSNGVVISAKGVTTTVPITAIGQNPAKLVISPSSQQTLVTSVGQPSSPLVFRVSNSGDLATGTLVVAITGANKADFTATPGAGCTLIAPFGDCSISVVFNPAAVTTADETAALTVTDSGTGASTVPVPLSGKAVPPSALAITPAASDLGAVLVGATGAVSTFTVTNGGASASGALKVTISSSEFVNANDTCTGTSLSPA
ncbi:MAG TPA: choice-of-anchor D domain-containing protein, partial [Polyangia bacterium]